MEVVSLPQIPSVSPEVERASRTPGEQEGQVGVGVQGAGRGRPEQKWKDSLESHQVSLPGCHVRTVGGGSG